LDSDRMCCRGLVGNFPPAHLAMKDKPFQ
jgi:hypothetical protein